MSTRAVIGGIALTVLAIVVISWSVFTFRVATSDARGQGDAVIQKNSANNRIAAQERFEDLNADIEATQVRITNAAAAAKANPDDRTVQQTLTGTVAYCIDLVAEYNAEARSYTAEDFRAIDLPARIDPAEACPTPTLEVTP